MGMAYVARDKTISLDPIISYLEWVELYLKHIQDVEAAEKAKNEPLLYSYQNWTYYCPSTSMHYSISRVDGAMVDYKSISEFKRTLQYQASSVKRLYAYMSLNYDTMENGKTGGRDHRSDFNLSVGYNGFKFEYNIDPNEKALFDATNTFVAKIDAMPIKLDRIIRFKELIIMKVGFEMGLIPAAILALASVFVPALQGFYRQYFIAFPFLALAVAFIFGIFFGGARLSSSYSKLIPTKYGGYNTKTRQSYRVDDMDTFCEEVDVLMGEKADLGKARQYIEKSEKLFSIFLPIGLGAVLLASGFAAIVLFFI